MGHGEAMANLFARCFVFLAIIHCVAVIACRANCALYVGLVAFGTVGYTFTLGLTFDLGLTLGKGLDLMYPFGRVPAHPLRVLGGAALGKKVVIVLRGGTMDVPLYDDLHQSAW